jgi:hypothetical protein
MTTLGRFPLWLLLLIGAWTGCGGESTAPPEPRIEQATVGAARDNTLYQSADGSLSNGAGQYVFAGNNNLRQARRVLLQFDLAAAGVPATATVDSVSLTLSMSRSEFGGTQGVALHRVTASWGEGGSHAPGEEGMGAPPASGDATWIHRFFGGERWAQPGGAFAASPSATIPVGQEGVYTWRASGMVADVQSWVQQPANNFGWILIGDESAPRTAKRFDSRTNVTPQARPSLTVHYKVP